MKPILAIIALSATVRSAAAATLELVPGYQVCSVYYRDCQAAKAEEFAGRLFFAPAGTETFTEALPLIYDPGQKVARGSLLLLREDTPYRLKLEISDAGKKETVTREFRTRTTRVPVAKTVLLDENTPMPLVVTQSGSPQGYIRYTAKPGTVLRGGEKADDAILVKGASYLLFGGLTVTGGRLNAFRLDGCNEVQILNCEISGYGRTGVLDTSRTGVYYDKRKRVCNYDSGIRVNGCRNILIERNYIHSPRGTSNPWFYSHPAGPNAVLTGDAVALTLRYNDFIGSDLHRWNDAIAGWYNGSPEGGPRRDAEITGNYFAFDNDDGMELDGGQENTRFFLNRTEGNLCGISAAPCLIGPSWIWGNLFSGLDGDQFGFSNYAFKNMHSKSNAGRIHYFHNTVVGEWGGTSNQGANQTGDTLSIVTRNNCFATDKPAFLKSLFRHPVDCDGDLYRNTGTVPKTQQRHGIDASPRFVAPERNDFRLASDSPGRGRALPIPGLTAEGSDVGAYFPFVQHGFPHRSLPVRVSAERLSFTASGAGDWPTRTIQLAATDPKFRGRFTVRSGDDAFFRVTPESGELDGTKPLSLSVAIRPEKIISARKNLGAFTIRFADGLSRPVSVCADSTRVAALLKQDRRNVISGTAPPEKDGKFTLNFQLEKPGRYFLFIRSDAPNPDAFSVTLNGEAVPRGINARLQRRTATGPRWMSPILAQTPKKTNRPAELAAGTHKIRLAPRNTQAGEWRIEACALAATPEELLLAPEMP